MLVIEPAKLRRARRREIIPLTDKSGAPAPEELSLLASLVPLVEEEATPEGTTVRRKSPEVLFGTRYDDGELPLASIDDAEGVHMHTRILWNSVVPLKIKRCISELLFLGLLTWSDVLEDGNLLWEVRSLCPPIQPRGVS